MIASLVAVVVAILIIFSLTNSNERLTFSDPMQDESAPSSETVSWRETELKNILTGETYVISEFEKPVLLESFAVWCPTCTQQQKEIKKLHEKLGDSVVSISLNTDPNEDEQKVLTHIQNNGFDWIYSISPTKVTQSLIDEFGVGIVNAPSAPVLLVCEGGTSRLLGWGPKSSEKLEEEINKGC